MLKYLTLLVVFVLAYAFIKSKSRKILKTDDLNSDSKPAVEDMARCEHCGVHFPLNEGFRSKGLMFCSDEHRKEKDRAS
ncbi:MAG: hypothetical protein HOJ43_05005 [Betaproteobacteria bacterium]|nr:hypothetical protein [Betaproteobacteria bacterium]